MMTNKEFAAKLIDVAKNYKTLYVNGCFGAPMTEKNKERYTKNTEYNRRPERTAMINAASSDTFGFDCVCLLKGILWGWCGDQSKQYGGAIYKSNGVGDIAVNSMLEKCSDVSEDFSKIEVGEFLWMEGHVGAYVGDGLAVECTPKWENKVQITACNRSISGYNRRNWVKHGKLPFINYLPEEEEKKEEEEVVEFGILDVVKLKEGVTRYSSGQFIPSWLPAKTLYVRGFRSGGKIVVSTLKEGDCTGVFYPQDLVLIERAKKEEEKQEEKPEEETKPEPAEEQTEAPEAPAEPEEPEEKPEEPVSETPESKPEEETSAKPQEEPVGEESEEGSTYSTSKLKKVLTAIIDFIKALLSRLEK